MPTYNKHISQYIEDHQESDFKQLDLQQFLEETKSVELASTERLRQLAILIEQSYWGQLEERWKLLDTIYNKAIELDPSDSTIWESRGISAYELSEDSTEESFTSILLQEAKKAYANSFELGNKESRLLYLWGLVYYPRDYEKAIEKFQLAIEQSPPYNMAYMYLGYAYFDQQNWKLALHAFEQANEEELRGHWEKIKRWELIGCAKIELNEVEEGLNLLETKVIPEYELGRYHSVDLELSLVYPSEMIKVLKDKGLQELVDNIEKLLA